MPKKRGPIVTFTYTGIHVEHRGRALDIPVYESEEADALIELDAITHYADGEEIALEDFGTILDAIEEAAEEDGLALEFE
jgi:hypothetical protein